MQAALLLQATVTGDPPFGSCGAEEHIGQYPANPKAERQHGSQHGPLNMHAWRPSRLKDASVATAAHAQCA